MVEDNEVKEKLLSEVWERHRGLIHRILCRLWVDEDEEAWHIARIALWTLVVEDVDESVFTTALWNKLVDMITQWKVETAIPCTMGFRNARFRYYALSRMSVSISAIEESDGEEYAALRQQLMQAMAYEESGYGEVEEDQFSQWLWSELCRILDERSLFVIRARYFEDKAVPRQQIAETLNLSEAGVRFLESRALKTIRSHIQSRLKGGLLNV